MQSWKAQKHRCEGDSNLCSPQNMCVKGIFGLSFDEDKLLYND